MGYTLFNRVGSGGHIIEAALHLAEIPFELVLLDSKPGTPLPETFRTTNPWRQVPTLILPDGSTMTETAAMLIDLATRFPDKLLAPAPGTAAHGQFLRWTIFASINVYEAMLRYNYPHRYTTDASATDAVRESALARSARGLLVLEQAVGDAQYVVGAELTIVDVYVVMLRSWFDGELQTLRLDQIKISVLAHPLLGPLWRRHFPDD